MSESIKTVLITGGFMLAVIILNELAFLLREKRIRKKEFFNQFFPERLKAHEEIFRIMTEGGLTDADPKRDTLITIKKHVERLNGAAHNALVKGSLFADKRVCVMLLDLTSARNAIIKHGSVNEKPEPESEFAESVARFNYLYYELLGTIRKKSGVNLIEEVFESILQKGDADSEGEKKD
jgi:hypothetical protein